MQMFDLGLPSHGIISRTLRKAAMKLIDTLTTPFTALSGRLKEQVDLAIQERAVLALKSELTMRHKSFEDYSDEEIEIMLSEEKRKIIDDLKTKSLFAVLALFGISLV